MDIVIKVEGRYRCRVGGVRREEELVIRVGDFGEVVWRKCGI